MSGMGSRRSPLGDRVPTWISKVWIHLSEGISSGGWPAAHSGGLVGS